MKIILTASQVPFSEGGAEYHVKGLFEEIKKRGHQIELIRVPFMFSNHRHINATMTFCKNLNLNSFDGCSVDMVLSLQFPGYGVQHDNHRIWLMHQHRAVYDLYDPQNKNLRELKSSISDYDFNAISNAKYVYSNSKNVSNRLLKFNQLNAKPLYHPPPLADNFYTDEPLNYVFFPSRLESLKRQDLLINAAKFLRSPVKIIIGGEGGQKLRYAQLIQERGLEDRVKLIGKFSQEEKLVLYARSLAVFFGPVDEDYGYITLEAMLSQKPVITCCDSGGPLEFVRHMETGLIVEPSPEAVAYAIDKLYENKQLAKSMGVAGRKCYEEMGISWESVCQELLSD